MEIHIVYCTDDNFAMICATSMVSVMENKGNEKLYFHIINNQISNARRERIRGLVEKYKDCQVDFYSFPDLDKIFSEKLQFDDNHISISSFGRLFLERVFPFRVPRWLYLDCDTIVLKSLSELYSFDLHGMTLGGVDDCKSKKYRWVLGIPSGAPYINAGVLLIDDEAWRKNHCEEKLIEYLKHYRGKVHFEDQGTINAVLYDQIMLLPLQYNVMTHLYDFSFDELVHFRQPVIRYTEEELKNCKKNPMIIHFTTSFMTHGRVWNSDTDHQLKLIYQKYMKLAGCDDATPSKSLSCGKNVQQLMVERLPRRLVLELATFKHEVIEPLKFRMIMKNTKIKNVGGVFLLSVCSDIQNCGVRRIVILSSCDTARKEAA